MINGNFDLEKLWECFADIFSFVCFFNLFSSQHWTKYVCREGEKMK